MSKPWKLNFNKKIQTQSINSKISGKNLKDNNFSIKNLLNKIETKMLPSLSFQPGLEKCQKNTKILHSLLTQKKSVNKPWLPIISFTSLLKNTINSQKICKTSWLKIKFWENYMVFLTILVLIWKKLKLLKNNNFKIIRLNVENFKLKLRSCRLRELN